MQYEGQKFKVLFSGPFPPPYAGPENAMKTLLESPLSAEFEISFLKTNVRSKNSQKGKIDLILVAAYFNFITALVKKIFTERPKLVYHFVAANRIGWMGRDIWCIIISRIFKVPIIIHMRAGHFNKTFENMLSIEKYVIKLVCKKVSLGIVQAECLKNQFQGIIPQKKVVAVYNAINSEKYTNENLDIYDENLILFLGHLSNAKGYCDILKIIPMVSRKYPKIKFCFAGEKIRKKSKNVTINQLTNEPLEFEDPEDCYNRNIKGRYEDNYRYLGILGEKEKIDILKKCNFLLLPTYSEGFSMAVLEALAVGKPIICTPTGALSEIIKDGVNGLIVYPGDHQGIAEAIDSILTNSTNRNLIANTNFVYARKFFSEEIISQQIAELFDKALENDCLPDK